MQLRLDNKPEERENTHAARNCKLLIDTQKECVCRTATAASELKVRYMI